MTRTKCLSWAVALALALGAVATVRADAAAVPAQKPSPGEADKKREDFKNLSPEERRARMKECREKRDAMTPEQREAMREEFRERFDKRLADLQKKKADGTLSEQQARELERMEQMKKRFQQFGRPGGPPLKRPNGEKPSAPQKPAPDKPPATK